MNIKDYAGEKLGIFQVARFSGRDKNGHALWEGVCPHCQCLYSRRVDVLRRSISCGCLLSALRSACAKTHGESKTPEWNVHRLMVRRCTDPTDQAFKYYGGRGIKVCKRWLEDARNFISDMGRRPTADHEIDRIDNEGNYEPANCRWATRIEQANNKRSNVRVFFKGESHSLREWSTLTGIPHNALYLRIRRGMPIERALTQRARGAR